MKWNAESRVIREQTRELLGGLGHDAEEVATSLAAQGVRGKPRSAQGCAIAVYVGAVVAADNRVRSITVEDTRLTIRPAKRWSRPVAVRLPRPVRDFITGFDAEKFPRLLATPVAIPSARLAAKEQLSNQKGS
jgi:hypothetical protein